MKILIMTTVILLIGTFPTNNKIKKNDNRIEIIIGYGSSVNPHNKLIR